MKLRTLTISITTTMAVMLLVSLIGGGEASASTTSAPLIVPRMQVLPNQPAPQPIGHNAPAISGAPTQYSRVWSGYVTGTSTSTFQSVSSTYVQPAVTCPVSGAYTVFWVGLDGWSNNTVEQDGTAAYCNGTTPEYFAWWEMFPTNFIQGTIPISPGDTVVASVKYSRGRYHLTVKDKTAKTHFTTVQKCASNLTCSRDTAEWIFERPSFNGGTVYAPLADWGTSSLSDDEAAIAGGPTQPISGFVNEYSAIYMVNTAGTNLLATAGGLNNTGDSFFDTWWRVS